MEVNSLGARAIGRAVHVEHVYILPYSESLCNERTPFNKGVDTQVGDLDAANHLEDGDRCNEQRWLAGSSVLLTAKLVRASSVRLSLRDRRVFAEFHGSISLPLRFFARMVLAYFLSLGEIHGQR
jgi:hypothetical protein